MAETVIKTYQSGQGYTQFVGFACLVAASGGALFGYDNGVSGGVSSMPGFTQEFFPEINAKETSDTGSLYCQYNNVRLQWFTSALFLAGALTEVSGLTAYLNRYRGRTWVMQWSGISFMIAAVLLASAQHYAQLLAGRVLQGIAISFASVSVPLYNSEMAPAHLRGRLNQLFQIVLTGFIFIAQLINIGTLHIYPWGWRFSLGFAFVPSFILFLGGTFLPDSPNSLVERGFAAKGRAVLERIRGTTQVDEEYDDIVEKAEIAKQCTAPWRTLFSLKYLPQLTLAFTSTLFQQWTGINTIIFYAPQLFISLGAGNTNALIATLVVGICNHLSTYISFWLADHYGRRTLFLEAGVQMLIALLVIAVTLAVAQPGAWLAWFILVMVCIFDMAYAWSYGPLAWLYPTEIQPLETRSAGQAVTSFTNLLFSFVIGQTYLTMLCAMRWGVFILFGGCVIFMTVFVYLFFPETKNVPIEECPLLFKRHWFWKRFANMPSKYGLASENKVEANMINEKMEHAPDINSDVLKPTPAPATELADRGAVTRIHIEHQ